MAIFKAPPPPLPAKNKSTNRREMCSLLSPPAYPSIVLFEVFEPPAQCTGFSLIIILIGSFYRACIVRCFPLSNGSDFDFLPCVLIYKYTNSCINVCTHTHTQAPFIHICDPFASDRQRTRGTVWVSVPGTVPGPNASR